MYPLAVFFNRQTTDDMEYIGKEAAKEILRIIKEKSGDGVYLPLEGGNVTGTVYFGGSSSSYTTSGNFVIASGKTVRPAAKDSSASIGTSAYPWYNIYGNNFRVIGTGSDTKNYTTICYPVDSNGNYDASGYAITTANSIYVGGKLKVEGNIEGATFNGYTLVQSVFRTVTTGTSLTIDASKGYNYAITLSAVSTLSVTNVYDGWEACISVLNSSSADITQPLPNSSSWQCDAEELTLPAGKVAEISIKYMHGIYYVKI
jgi:hypothetical protein